MNFKFTLEGTRQVYARKNYFSSESNYLMNFNRQSSQVKNQFELGNKAKEAGLAIQASLDSKFTIRSNDLSHSVERKSQTHRSLDLELGSMIRS